mmetsp:Transcript_19167/g.44655  ORF Transcript_19167/g.44655 Transcript_19167/m.44655 type:complete len:201 (-) Transcript_19167:43-645(-)
MTRIMTKDGISWLCFDGNLLIGCQNIIPRGRWMIAIIHQDCHVAFMKSTNIHEIFLHVVNIIMTTTQFTGIVSNVIDSNQYGSFGPRATGWNNVKWKLDIQGTRRRKLWNLRVTSACQNFPHLHQDVLKTQILLTFRGIQDLQQGRCTGTTGSTGRIGQLKTGHVGDIRTRLFILATTNHTDLRRNQLLGLFQRHDDDLR